MLRISSEVFGQLENNGIRYCHWKSNEHLLEGMNGVTDLDVLADISQKEQCEKVLHELRFLKVKAPVGNRYRYVDDWIGMDYDTGEMIHFHLHYRIVTGKQYRKEWVLPWSRLALKYRVKDDNLGVYVMNPNMEIIVLYTRIIMKTKYEEEKKDTINVPEEYIREIRYLKKITEKQEIRRFMKMMYKETDDVFEKCLFKESFAKEEYIKYKNYIWEKLKKFRTESNDKTCIMHYTIKYFQKFQKFLDNRNIPVITKKTPNKDGLLVAFIGADGAGKSTMTENIKTWLNWKIEVHKFYLGSGDGLKKPISYKIYSNSAIPVMVRQWAGAFFYIFMSGYLNRTLKRIKAYCKKGGIALVDRFPQVQYNGLNDGPKIKTNISGEYVPASIKRKFEKKEYADFKEAVKYQPDVVIILDISPEESVRRKHENTLAEMKRKIASLNNLKFEDSKVYHIDAVKNMNEEILEVKRIIWDELYQRQSL